MASDKFIRWQEYRIEQLAFAQNLFLGLSVGALAFGISLVRDEGFFLSGRSKIVFGVGLAALALSIVLGCAAVVSRLLDFRSTAAKIRADEKDDAANEAGVYKNRSEVFGTLTWSLFWLELLSFVIGLVGLTVGLCSRYGGRVW